MQNTKIISGWLACWAVKLKSFLPARLGVPRSMRDEIPISSAAAALGQPCPPVLGGSGHHTSAAAPWLPTLLLFAPQNCPGPIFMGYF